MPTFRRYTLGAVVGIIIGSLWGMFSGRILMPDSDLFAFVLVNCIVGMFIGAVSLYKKKIYYFTLTGLVWGPSVLIFLGMSFQGVKFQFELALIYGPAFGAVLGLLIKFIIPLFVQKRNPSK
jgi:FtsH-binding integral membrane protein